MTSPAPHGVRQANAASSKEDRTTAALVDLINACPPKLRATVICGLLTGVPDASRVRHARQVGLRARMLTGTSRPDFVLHDACGTIKVVVEHKQQAQDSCVPVAPYRGRPASGRFKDPYARGFALVPATEQADQPHVHPPKLIWERDGCPLGCTVHKTVRGSGGLVVAVISQLDRYRVFRDWVDDLAPDLVLDDPESAIWLLLDQRGRALASSAWASYTAADRKWCTTGYESLLPLLRGLREDPASPSDLLPRLTRVLDLCG